jgi:hypothetical protein
MGWNRFKISVDLWWRRWKIVHTKRIYDCELNELFSRRRHHKYMTFTYLCYIIVCLGMIVEMYFKEQGDIVINTMLILVTLALYDSRNEINYIDRFIYDKIKENGL